MIGEPFFREPRWPRGPRLTQAPTFTITPQPDDVTCGPASLHAVYRHYGLDISLIDVIRGVRRLPHRGTLAVFLGLHALRHGFDVTIYTANLHLFDPTWFAEGARPLAESLRLQMAAKPARDTKLHTSSRAYLEYLEAGGKVRMEDVSAALLSALMQKGPIIAGLSETWLYRGMRDNPQTEKPDDVGGEPSGHFLVLYAYDPAHDRVRIADPWKEMPFPGAHHYDMPVARVIGAIMLGIVTYDAKLLVITPRDHKRT